MNIFSYFKSNKTQNIDTIPITVDIHSHLLPGIDDGVKSMKDAITIIKKFKMLGYSKLITTPHIIPDFYPANKELIIQKLQAVRTALQAENIEIILEASAEYYVDMNFLKLIEEDELIPFMGHYILFETGYTSKPMILEVAIKALIEKGYIPVLAHPEQYIYLHHDINLYKELKAMGVLFQVNIKSLQYKSKSVYKIAKKLIQLNLVDFVGSDVHRIRDMEKLERTLQTKEYLNMITTNKILNNH
ncbi:MAG TPA: capsular biosynthesis protein [Sulfurimonas autotrophica]|nr:capsular biosynthesis protein [Sulfurimonas autotrophica]